MACSVKGLLATLALASVALVGKVVEGGGVGQALPNFATGGGHHAHELRHRPELRRAVHGARHGEFPAHLDRHGAPPRSLHVRGNRRHAGTQAQSVAANRYFNAGLQCVIAYALVASGTWSDLWPLFGGANQLLAALALLTATVWLANWDRSKQLLSTGVPMAAMTIVTVLGLLYLALYENIWQKFVQGGSMSLGTALSAGAQTIIALVLVGLALSLVRIGYQNITSAQSGSGRAPVTDGGESEPDD